MEVRFKPLVPDRAAEAELEAALERRLQSGLAEVESLPEPFRRSLERPGPGPWGSPRRTSRYFLWLEFATAGRMFEREPRRALATAFVEWGQGPAVLAAFQYGSGPHADPPFLLRVRAGEGIRALERQLERLAPSVRESGEVALANEEEYGPLGWLVYAADGRRWFWPALPERFGRDAGVPLSESEFLRTFPRKPSGGILTRFARRLGWRA